MSFGDFISKVEKIENLVNGNDLLREESKFLKDEDIKSIEAYQSDYDETMRENRLLRIAILGRVKAGKSSFLNTLLFDGEEILPQAATPMTAALSKIEYAEQNSVEAEFYSDKDLEQIATNAKEFESLLTKCKDDKVSKLLEKERAKNGENAELSEAQKDSVEKSAFREAKQNNEVLCACYEQNELIKKRNIDSATLQKHKSFSGSLQKIQMSKLSIRPG